MYNTGVKNDVSEAIGLLRILMRIGVIPMSLSFDVQYALVSWETINELHCGFIALGCRGTFSGSYFQPVEETGIKVGDVI